MVGWFTDFFHSMTQIFMSKIHFKKQNIINCHLTGELDSTRIFRVGSGYTSVTWQVTFRRFWLTQPTSKTDFFGGAEIEDYMFRPRGDSWCIFAKTTKYGPYQ